MDESYLTGEPYQMSKTPGSEVLSGAINGDSVLTIRATKLAVDSRYAKIMQVMRASEQQHPRLRRLGDQLGAYYTPVAVAIALVAWFTSGQADRFLAVLVVATPIVPHCHSCGHHRRISLAAKRAIIVKNQAVLELIATCRTIIFDKTGTLTYGEPKFTERVVAPAFTPESVLTLAASLEQYSKHPLSRAILTAARSAGGDLQEASEISERAGEGLRGTVAGQSIQITSRHRLMTERPALAGHLLAATGGMECVVLIGGITRQPIDFATNRGWTARHSLAT